MTKRGVDDYEKCINASTFCFDAEEFTTCLTCDSTICKQCSEECDFCINFGDSHCVELPNHCTTCKARICNNCARMCINCYDFPDEECIPIIECKQCADGKYTELPCKCEFLWRCKHEEKKKENHDYCPRCRSWENACGKMGY